MKTMYLYEPAMCCPTGLCGPSIDPELLRISNVLKNLERHGIKVQRFNLKNYPNEFVKNNSINQLITQQGMEALPATIIDGKILKTGKYPTNEEIAGWLGIPLNSLGSVVGTNRAFTRQTRPADGGFRGGRF